MLISNAIPGFITGYFSTCRRSPRTQPAYSADLKQFAGALPKSTNLADVTWAHALKVEGYAPTSIRRKLASVTAFFNYRVRRRTIERSPPWQLRLDLGGRRLLTRTLSEPEIRSILAEALG